MRPQKFITKNIKYKNVRQSKKAQVIIEEPIMNDVVQNKEENKKEILKEDMNNVDMNQVDALLQAEETKLPKRKVKVEKKDKGLFERTENSRVILTEDNKMLLND